MTLIIINITQYSAEARLFEPRSDNLHGWNPARPQRRGAEKTHDVGRMVRGPQCVSSTLFAFKLSQAAKVNVSARKDADLVLDAGKNAEPECSRVTPGGTRKRPRQWAFDTKTIVLS